MTVNSEDLYRLAYEYVDCCCFSFSSQDFEDLLSDDIALHHQTNDGPVFQARGKSQVVSLFNQYIFQNTSHVQLNSLSLEQNAQGILLRLSVEENKQSEGRFAFEETTFFGFTNTQPHKISSIQTTVAKRKSDLSTSDHVFVVSEWLPKLGCEQELWHQVKEIMALTKQEKGCVRATATKQIPHPGSPGKSKYKIILLQEYINVKAFDIHCESDYVKHFFKKYIENKSTSIVEDWTCRLFSEDE